MAATNVIIISADDNFIPWQAAFYVQHHGFIWRVNKKEINKILNSVIQDDNLTDHHFFPPPRESWLTSPLQPSALQRVCQPAASEYRRVSMMRIIIIGHAAAAIVSCPDAIFYIWPLYLFLDISTIFATLQKWQGMENSIYPCIAKRGSCCHWWWAKPIHSTQGLGVGPITTAQSEENCEKKLSCRQWW